MDRHGEVYNEGYVPPGEAEPAPSLSSLLPTRENLSALGLDRARVLTIVACALVASMAASAVHLATRAVTPTETRAADEAPEPVPARALLVDPRVDPPSLSDRVLPREVSYKQLPRAHRHRQAAALDGAPGDDDAVASSGGGGAPEPSEQIDPATGEVSVAGR